MPRLTSNPVASRHPLARVDMSVATRAGIVQGLDRIAARKGITRNRLIVQLLDWYVTRDGHLPRDPKEAP